MTIAKLTARERPGGRYSSEDLHRELFATPPEPRTLEEMKEGIRADVEKRHPRGGTECPK